jgi:hypothetical protein
MDFDLKKMLTAAATSLVAFTSYASADYDDAQMRNLENRVTVLEQKKGANGMINPPARPVIEDGLDVFVSADMIVWKAQENGLGFVVKNENGVVYINDGKIKNPSFDWDFGFKLGLGVNMGHDGWDVYAQWTRLHTDATNTEHQPSGGRLFPTFRNVTFSEPGTMSSAHAHWKLHLNMIDAELGREFFVSKWLTLRPFGGLRTAWISQNYKINYNYDAIGDVLKNRLKNHFWGLGLLTGLDAQWGMGGGWSIYGGGAVSLLYGNFRIREKERLQTPTTTSTRALVRNKFNMTDAITDLEAGLRWKRAWECVAFKIQAGWEQHAFYGQNQLAKFIDAVEDGAYVSNQGDLTFQGWALNVQLDF